MDHDSGWSPSRERFNKLMALIVNLVDFNTRNSWLEGQIPLFIQHGLTTALITISPHEGELHDSYRNFGANRVTNINRGLIGTFRGAKILHAWREDKPLIIFAHGHLASIYALLFRILLGTRYVICHHQQPNFFRLLSERKPLTGALHLALTRVYIACASRIQSLSVEVFETLKSYRVSNDKIWQIPLGIPFDNYGNSGQKAKASKDKVFKIISVGRLVWEKRIDLGIQAMKHLNDKGYNISYQIVGIGPELHALSQLANNLQISQSIHFLGYRNDVNDLITESMLFLHLSQTESYGQAIMEARMANKPILSTRCGVAIDLNLANDSLVKLFKSDNLEHITKLLEEEIAYIQEIVTPLAQESPTEKYKLHEYNAVMHQLASSFHLLFRL